MPCDQCKFFKITTLVLFIALVVCVLALANNSYFGQIKGLFLAKRSNQKSDSNISPDLSKYKALADKACLVQGETTGSSTPNSSSISSDGCIQSFFAQKAMEEGNLGLCQLVTNVISHNSCLNSVNLILASKNQSVDNCKQLLDPSQVIACSNEVYLSLANSDTTNARQYCNQIVNSDGLKQSCLSRFAK